MNWHADDEMQINNKQKIWNVSLGRRFRIRHSGEKQNEIDFAIPRIPIHSDNIVFI